MIQEIALWAGWVLFGIYLLALGVPNILYELGYEFNLPWWRSWECTNCHQTNHHPVVIDLWRKAWECPNCEELNWAKATDRRSIPDVKHQ